MLILDVQGYEDRVLEGAAKTVKAAKAVLSELSLDEIYTGGSTFDSVYQALVREGFRLRQFLNPVTGVYRRILQIDALFIRR